MNSSIRINTLRIVAGFLLAPLASCIVYYLVRGKFGVGTFVFLGYVYGTAFLLGIPALAVCLKFRWLHYWQVIVSGLSLSFIAALIWFPNHFLHPHSWRALISELGFFLLTGWAISTLFWVIALCSSIQLRLYR